MGHHTTLFIAGKRKAGNQLEALPSPCTGERPSKRHQSTPESLVNAFAKLLSPRQLHDLPPEILLQIFQHFAEPWVLTDDLPDSEDYILGWESRIRQKTLVALTKTCRWLNQPATSILYRCAHLPTYRSLKAFLRALYVQPSLTGLVKQISCRPGVLSTVTYTFQRFTDHDIPVTLNHQVLWSGRSRLGYFCLQDQESVPEDEKPRYYVRVYALDSLLERITGLRVLSVNCDRPWHLVTPASPFPLEHLSKLSIHIGYEYGYSLIPSLPVSEDRTLSWLTRSSLGRYPALKQLEIIHLGGRWVANMVTMDATGGPGAAHGTEKYVSSLTTDQKNGRATSEWELLSLSLDIFSPQHLHTLDYAGQSWHCRGSCSNIHPSGWNLNRFLATTGRGVKTLSLDWEHQHTQLGQLGLPGILTSLPMLTSLTHLTVSIQLLFGRPSTFYGQMLAMTQDPAAELARMLPPSLRVLRISEFINQVVAPWPQRLYDSVMQGLVIARFNSHLWKFMQLLRAYWLDARGDRELWFRHSLELERHQLSADDGSRRMLRWIVSPHWNREDVGTVFARVHRMLPLTAANFRDENDSKQSQEDQS
jgi:hypothetical protein